MRVDTGWFTKNMLEVLIELACPNTHLPPKGKDFVADLGRVSFKAEGVKSEDAKNAGKYIIPFRLDVIRGKKNRPGQPVRCIVRETWLQFLQGSCHLEEGEAMFLHVMTEGANGKDRDVSVNLSLRARSF